MRICDGSEVLTVPKQRGGLRRWALAAAAGALVLVLSACADVPAAPPDQDSSHVSAQVQKHDTPAPQSPAQSELPADRAGQPSEAGEVPETGGAADALAPEDPRPGAAPPAVPGELAAGIGAAEADIAEEAVALSASPIPVPHTVSAVASGLLEKRSKAAVIDYSNTADGYVMVQYLTPTELRLKVLVKGPATTYTYNLAPQAWTVFPLSDGNGTYQISVYKNVTGTKYAAELSVSTQVELKDEFAPFLHSNQYVDYDRAPKTVEKASALIASVSDPLKQVEIVYDYVVKGMTYDRELAASVKSGYLPVLDSVLEKQRGICFDYAALMTGMLRSQGVPCKLVVGYAGTAYHAWISVWVDGSGWVDGVIWFNGSQWHRMDPTFASSGGSSPSILSYIGDGTNYTAKYFY